MLKTVELHYILGKLLYTTIQKSVERKIIFK